VAATATQTTSVMFPTVVLRLQEEEVAAVAQMTTRIFLVEEKNASLQYNSANKINYLIARFFFEFNKE